MAKVVVKSKIKKVKRKYPVEMKAPDYLNSVSLGKSEVTDLNSMIGKTVKLNLMYVTGNVKNQNVRLVFTVFEVNSGLAKTQVTSYSQIPYYLGRFVKKGSDLVEDSFIAKTKDGIDIKVKPFIVTKNNVSKMVLTALRVESKKIISQEISTKNYDDFIESVINGKVQISYRNDIKKITPIKTFEFRKIEMLKNK